MPGTNAKAPWFSVVNLSGEVKNAANPRSAEIAIMDQIGEDWWTGQGITAGAFMRTVDALGELDEILLRINSPGGDVMDGLTIANYLMQHPAKVTVRVEGQAASIASVIMMAGEERVMGLGTSVFVHDPISGLIGDADEMRAMADELDKIRDGIIEVYQSRVNLSRDELITLMRDDTRMTADEAIAWGFATGSDAAIKAAACVDMDKVLARAREQATARASHVTEVQNISAERDSLRAKLEEATTNLEAANKKLVDAQAERETINGRIHELTARVEKLQNPEAQADAATVIALCAEHDITNLAAPWVQAKMPMPQVQARIRQIAALKDIATAAGEDPAPYIARIDDPVEMMRVAIVNLKAAKDQQIDNSLHPGVDAGGKTGNGTAAIYRQRNSTKLLMRG